MVAGPAPCAARLLPNSINLSRVMSCSFTRPRETFSALSTMNFDRRMGLPTWAKSSICNAIRSENMRGASCGRDRLIGVPRSIERTTSSAHSSASQPSGKNIRSVLSLPPYLNAPASRLQLRKGRHCVCTPFRFRVRYVCTGRSNEVHTCAILASLECTQSAHVLDLFL